MRRTRILPIMFCVFAVSGLSACDKADREKTRVELTQGAAEFVAVMRDDVENALAWLQETLENQVREDRLAHAAADGDLLPAPGEPNGPAPVVGPEDGPLLFELLQRRNFKKSWMSMFEGAQGLPDWIDRFNSGGDGVATPAANVTRGSESYVLAWVCEPHNCGFSYIRVLFTPDGRRAWGLFVNDDDRTWLGDPEPWMLPLLDRD